MDARIQNVEQRLQNVDELQETIMGFRDEIRNMGRTFRQEMQAMVREMRNIAHGPTYEKQMIELTHLQQIGTLAEFNVKFDTISARLDLSEAYLVDLYVGALKEEIANSIRLFNPRTLVEARRMARVQEISLLWRSKKMVLPIKNGLQGKFLEPQEPIAMQEGCDGDFKMGQDSFINIESSSTFNFKTQGSVADGGFVSWLSSNTVVGNVEITSGVNRSWRFDSVGGVSKTISPVSSSVSSSTGSVSSLTSRVASVLTRDNAKITFDANESSIFDFAKELQALSYYGDRCGIRKQTSESGSQLVIFRVIGFPNFLISSTVQPATTTIPSCIGLQLAATFKWQKYYGNLLNAVIPYGYMGLESVSGEKNPIKLQLGFTIPLGAINYGLFQQWPSFLNFSPTRILMLAWFKGELIIMLFGQVCSLTRKKRSEVGNAANEYNPMGPVAETSSPTSKSFCQNLKPMFCFQIYNL